MWAALKAGGWQQTEHEKVHYRGNQSKVTIAHVRLNILLPVVSRPQLEPENVCFSFQKTAKTTWFCIKIQILLSLEVIFWSSATFHNNILHHFIWF